MWHPFTIVELLPVSAFLFAEDTSGIIKFWNVLNVKDFFKHTHIAKR